MLPWRLFGFAFFAMGRGAAPDANGGQVAVRVGVRGSPHTHPHLEAQTQHPHPAVRQRGVAGLLHQSGRPAAATQAVLRLPGRDMRLTAGTRL